MRPVAKKPSFVQIRCGPLPVDTVNRTLNLELDPGDVVLSINAQKHAARRHPHEYSTCLPHIGGVIANPLYLGDDVKNEGKIELVARVSALGSGLLVAVNIEPDNAGFYHVVSFYPVSEEKIERRRRRGFVVIAKRKGSA